MRTNRPVLGILTALLLLSGIAHTPGLAAQAAPVGGPVADVALPQGRMVSLSPDGTMLATIDRSERPLCVYAVDTMEEVSCAESEQLVVPVNAADISWSPDSSRIVFAQDAFILMRDSDLWILDVQSGTLTNLTDDGFEDSIFPPSDTPSDFFVDVAPAWTPGGDAITFSRTLGTDGQFAGNVLAQIPAAGGAVETLAQLSTEQPGVFYLPGGWSPDGAFFSLSISSFEPDDPDNGIWTYDAATGETRQLASTDDPELGTLALRMVSPRGDRLLAYYPNAAAQGYIGKSVQRFVDPVSGEISPIPDPNPESEIFQGSWFSTFSPDGRYLLQPNGISGTFDYWVTDLDTGESTMVASALEQAGPVDTASSPVWASNGVAGVAHGIDAAYLFPIEGAGTATVEQASASPVASLGASPAASPVVDALIGTDVRTVGLTPIFAGPDFDSPLVVFLAPHSIVHVLADPVHNQGQVWYPVFVPASQIIGYIQANHLE